MILVVKELEKCRTGRGLLIAIRDEVASETGSDNWLMDPGRPQYEPCPSNWDVEWAGL